MFSPNVNHSSTHTLLNIVAMHDFELQKLDMNITFLHSELEESNYMEKPKGIDIP